jgi:hypothetical protein
VTLQFGAHNSPLVQPRSCFLGNLVASSASILTYYLTDDFNRMPQWVAVALAPAISIAAMQKLGVSHPPAGAAALIFISAVRRHCPRRQRAAKPALSDPPSALSYDRLTDIVATSERQRACGCGVLS